MKRFQFPLERVLRFRRTQAEVEQAKLTKLETEMSQLRQKRSEVVEAFRTEVQRVGADSRERLELGRYRMVVETQLLRLDQSIAEKAKQVAAQKNLYVKAKQAAEVLDKVKDKQYKNWEKDLQKELDALAMDSYLSRWKQ